MTGFSNASTTKAQIDAGTVMTALSDHIMEILDNCTVILNALLSVFGIVTNIINMAVFRIMGFKESINVSLFGLALSDSIFCVTMVVFSISGTTWMKSVFFQAGLHPLLTSTFLGLLVQSVRLVTPLLTAYIAVERCLCVAMPLKIKLILTPRRVWYIVIGTDLYAVFRTIPEGFCYKFAWIYDSRYNATLLDLLSADKTIVDVTIPLDSVVYIGLISVTIICTGMLITHIKKANAAWASNNSNSSSGNKSERSKKSNRVVKMVTLITSLYIICFIPELCVMVCITIVPGFYPDGEYGYLMFWSWHLVATFYIINSVSNIFICYRNSTNYKQAFDKMFHITNEIKSVNNC